MAGASNSFEGGSNGTTITTGNSGGGGNAFTAASVMQYSTARAARGSVSGVLATGASGFVELPLSGTGTRYVRAYVYQQGYVYGLVALRLSTGARFTLNAVEGTYILYEEEAEGQIYIDMSGTAVVNQWIRVEMSASSSGGTVTARIFNDPLSATPSHTMSGSVASRTATWAAARFGGSNSSGAPAYWDDVAWSDTTWVGPVVPDRLPPAIPMMSMTAVHRASRW